MKMEATPGTIWMNKSCLMIGYFCLVASLISLTVSMVTASRIRQCFYVLIDIYHEFLLLFHCCILLKIKLTTTTSQWMLFNSVLSMPNGHPDSKVHGANMGPTCVLSAPGGPHVGPMNLALRVLVWIMTADMHHTIVQTSFEFIVAWWDLLHSIPGHVSFVKCLFWIVCKLFIISWHWCFRWKSFHRWCFKCKLLHEAICVTCGLKVP